MGLQGLNLKMLIEPLDDPGEMMEVQKEVETKTQAQRIRGVLFLIWRQEGEKGSFNDFYQTTTEKWLDKLKERLE